MKPLHIILSLIASITFGMLIGNTVQARANVPANINAEAWIVINQNTGDILLEKNIHEKHFPASITKIATAIFAIEKSKLNEIVSVSQTAANTEGSSLYLKEGDQLPLRDLLYGIMLHSGNDGAVAVAEHISNSERNFAHEMTAFVRTIGAKNTNFVNASGLPNDEHYTTAYDMAMITRYAMKNPIFREMVGHKTYNWDNDLWREDLQQHEIADAMDQEITWNGEPQIVNHNRLLSLYEGANGVKNGFTHEARYTLVGSAKRGNSEIIAVILKSDNVDTAYKDIVKLLDHGFISVQSEPRHKKTDRKEKEEVAKIASDEQSNKQSRNNEDLSYLFFIISAVIIVIIGLQIVRKRKLKK
jgi:D-alanyl-D-alanine carboxypeptidase (penicillin-binding protein 5/6)